MARKIDTISRRKKDTQSPVDTGKKKEKAPIKSPQPAAPVSESAEQYETMFPEPTVSLNHPPAWLLWLILVIFLGILAFIGYQITDRKLDGWLTPGSPSPTISPVTSNSPDPSPSPSVSPSATPEPTPTPSDEPTPTTLSKPDITLRILNGTTRNGAAAQAESHLSQDGFSIRTIGNARSRNYTSTIIYYQAGRQAEAELVQASLSNYSTTLEESTLANPDMVLVVIGIK